MKKWVAQISFGLCVLTFSACTTNKIIVIASNPSVNYLAAKPCMSDEDKSAGYPTAQNKVLGGLVIPSQAKSEHVNGCAAVKFQVGADGKATNITILRENPVGYGYGAATMDQVRRSTYQVPASLDTWFFINNGTVVAQ